TALSLGGRERGASGRLSATRRRFLAPGRSPERRGSHCFASSRETRRCLAALLWANEQGTARTAWFTFSSVASQSAQIGALSGRRTLPCRFPSASLPGSAARSRYAR